MANTLLDFVMSLVRDPEAAARYAADPEQAIAAADLTDVTSADVQNLIPVVAESLSMATPSHGLGAFDADQESNVWTSGAATAAFDAFADHLPERAVPEPIVGEPVVVDPQADLTDIVDRLGPGTDLLDTAESLQLDEPVMHDPVETDPADDWSLPAPEPNPGDHASGFDIFD